MKIYLANPRGFCAGVDRAIDIVELSLKAYGAPIYVRHEIVHSRHVVNSLKLKGAVFVEELTEVPDGQTVIFSAHGVAKSVWEEAKRRGLKIIDATCPLVIKVHNEVNREYTQGYELILIGHAGHPEVIGTLGQIPDKFHLVSSVQDVEKLQVDYPDRLSYVTQTTLSVDECRDIVGALHQRFPKIKGPHQEDICYATQNRQNAVKKLTEMVDVPGVEPAVNSPVLVIVPPPEVTAQMGVTASTLPLLFLTTTVNCCVPPTVMVAVVGEMVTVAATWGPVESPHAAMKNPASATAKRTRAVRARGISA